MSHHGHNDIENFSPMFEELRKHQEQIAGQYPNKRMVKSDEGALVFGVSTMGEKVIIAFGEPTAWMGMTGDQAAELGLLLIKRAKEAGLNKPLTITL